MTRRTLFRILAGILTGTQKVFSPSAKIRPTLTINRLPCFAQRMIEEQYVHARLAAGRPMIEIQGIYNHALSNQVETIEALQKIQWQRIEAAATPEERNQCIADAFFRF